MMRPAAATATARSYAARLLLASGLLLRSCQAQAGIFTTSTTETPQPIQYFSPPLCGLSKRRLDDDPVRRTCLRQCFLDDGYVRPTFSEWDQLCRETSHMADWDQECNDFTACTYGCEIYGGDRGIFTREVGVGRHELMMNTYQDMYASGITQEKRCELEKCHSYCAREAFGTCRETQYREKCYGSNPHLYGCDVDCSGSSRFALPHSGLVFVMSMVTVLIAMWDWLESRA